ncbi:hypothetical protein AAVH_22333 [Aphelenchoides avenae]|nr:hypothetical protein AAVH_22333 [Aphelenchus avenae]
MPVLMVNAAVTPPPRLLQPDGFRAFDTSAQEDDYLARLADEIFPVGDDGDDEDEPPPLDNNAPQPPCRLPTEKVPLAMRDTTKVKTHYAGKMDQKCSKCAALFYPGEARRGADGSYAPCCCFGAVSLPTTYDDFPKSVYELLKWEHPLSADFHRHVRNYNSSLSFASINCNIDRRYTGPGGPYCFRIHGNVYTLFNNGTYAEGVPSYAQLYVVDSTQATDYRM